MFASSQAPVPFSCDLNLSCAQSGHSDGIPLLLLHGYTDSWRSFAPLMQALPSWLRAIAVTQRGHGDSAKPSLAYDVDLFAMDVAMLLGRLSIDRAFVLGHSMGSLVAQRFALDWPERVAGLVLVGAFRTLKGNRAAGEFWTEAVSRLSDPIDPAFVAAFQKSCLAREVPAPFFDTIVEESLKAPAHVWRSVLGALLQDDFSHELGRIEAPTLVLHGAEDRFASSVEQLGLVTAIRDARLITYEGIGHTPHWEAPERAAADVADFIAAQIDAAPLALRQIETAA